MTRPVHAYAALLMPDSSDLDAGKFLMVARDVLALRDCPDDTPPRLSIRRCHTAGATLDLAVRASDAGPDTWPRIVIEARPFRDAPYETEHGARVLSDFVLASFELCDADYVEWDSPDIRLNREEFIDLRRNVSSRVTSVPSHGTPVNPSTTAGQSCAHSAPRHRLTDHRKVSRDAPPAATTCVQPPAPRANTLAENRVPAVDDTLELRLIRRFCIEMDETPPEPDPPAVKTPKRKQDPDSVREQTFEGADMREEQDTPVDTDTPLNQPVRRRQLPLIRTVGVSALRLVRRMRLRLRLAAQFGTIALLFMLMQTRAMGSVLAKVLP